METSKQIGRDTTRMKTDEAREVDRIGKIKCIMPTKIKKTCIEIRKIEIENW